MPSRVVPDFNSQVLDVNIVGRANDLSIPVDINRDIGVYLTGVNQNFTMPVKTLYGTHLGVTLTDIDFGIGDSPADSIPTHEEIRGKFKPKKFIYGY